MANGVATATKHYFFGGRHIALKEGAGPLTFLQQDYLGSLRLATVGSTLQASKGYHAFGSTRTGSLPTPYGYTGQAEDGTGLVYMHARSYDPTLGQFISPDSIVPEPERLLA
jgi:RHS repeat-associated protein